MWYEIVIDKGEQGTEGICSFETEKEAEIIAEAFQRVVEGRLFVAKEVGQNEV